MYIRNARRRFAGPAGRTDWFPNLCDARRRCNQGRQVTSAADAHVRLPADAELGSDRQAGAHVDAHAAAGADGSLPRPVGPAEEPIAVQHRARIGHEVGRHRPVRHEVDDGLAREEDIAIVAGSPHEHDFRSDAHFRRQPPAHAPAEREMTNGCFVDECRVAARDVDSQARGGFLRIARGPLSEEREDGENRENCVSHGALHPGRRRRGGEKLIVAGSRLARRSA